MAAASGRRRALLAFAGAGALLGRAGTALGADLPTVVALARPSVLPVGTFKATDNPRFTFRGTGFVIAEGNLLATNFHVLPEAADSAPDVQIAIAVPHVNAAGDAQVRLARVVASDRTRDLALLRFDGAPLPTLTMAEPGTARDGQSIALMGFPVGGTLGYSVVTHRGIVSAVTRVALPAPSARQLDARALSRLRDGNFEVLQLDATAYPGNSGGPVLDADSGRVIGIVNQVLVRNSRESLLSNPSGITYAIPIAQVQDLLRDYRAGAGAGNEAPKKQP